MSDYPKEQLQELYNDLPKDLQKAMFSKEVAANVQKICSKNKVTKDDIIFDITKNIGYVFLGLLEPNKFSDVLKGELKLNKKVAEEIASKITKLVFLPVRKNLEALYQTKIKLKAKAKKVDERPKRKDRYREKV